MPILFIFIFRGAGCTSCIAELTFRGTEHKFRGVEHNSSKLKTKNSPEEKAKNFARRKKYIIFAFLTAKVYGRE